MVKFFFILVMSVIAACAAHQDFVLIRQNNTSDKMVLDGYYYTVWNDGYYDAIFLYENGVVYHGFNNKFEIGMDSVDRKFLSTSFKSSNSYERNVRYIWGLYQTKGDSIMIERYVVPIFGERYQTYIQRGVIINNKQFVMTHVYFVKEGREKSIRDTFNFRPLPVKPDSTNNFIK